MSKTQAKKSTIAPTGLTFTVSADTQRKLEIRVHSEDPELFILDLDRDGDSAESLMELGGLELVNVLEAVVAFVKERLP